MAPHISNADINAIKEAFDEQEASLVWGGVEATKAELIARLARAEQLLLDQGLAIDRYETDGSLVYEDDDYVIDSEGCYLPRLDYEAFAAAENTHPTPAAPGEAPEPGA